MKTDRGAQVLFVSPDSQLTGILKTDLVEYHVEILGTRSRTEAIQQAQKLVPSAVVVDSRPAEQPSFGLMERVRKIVPPTTAIFWFSNDVTRTKAIQAMKCGANGVMVRPMTSALFVDTLTRVLERLSNPAAKRIRTSVPVPREPGPAEAVWEILDRAESLKTVPFVVQQVLTLTSADETGARDLEAVLLKDQNATAVVLKRANSPLFAASRKVTRIQEAITRLGFRNVRTLVMALSIIRNFDREQRRAGFDPVEFWKFSIASAILSRSIAASVKLPDPEAAYICGLLHGIGLMISDQFLTEGFHHAVNIAVDQGIPLVKAERAVLGIDHAEIGKGILERWSFPREICDVAGIVSPTHAPIPDPQIRALARIVWTADGMCRSLGFGDAVDRTVEPLPASYFAEMGLARPLSREVMERSIAEINDTWDLLGSSAPAEVPGREGQEIVALYEEERVPLSLVQLLTESAGVRTQPVNSLTELARLPETMPGVLHFKGVEGLRAAVQTSRTVLDRPYLILLPADQLPADDEVKKRVGFPVGRCRYLGLPVDAREVTAAVSALP